MASEKVDAAEHADDAGTNPDPKDSTTPAPQAGSDQKPPAGRDSGTAAAAARHRTVMQRRHLRIGLLMSLALGAEIIGAVGLLGAGLLPWRWEQRLWGAGESMLVTVQVAVGLVVLALILAWWRRTARAAVQSRAVLLVPAAVVVLLTVVSLWQADLGSRGAGAVVAIVAACLVIAGTTTWLIGLRQLRVLFPFGLTDSRTRGYGNLPAVRRAERIGAPASALGGAALLAGTVLVVPGWLSTVDFQSGQPLSLTGDAAIANGSPAWTVELTAAHDGIPTMVRPTGNGLLIEERTGVRMVDPRSGITVWHWRDQAYLRVGSALTDGGDTVVLALDYRGSATDRDRVVALDTATGDVRWDRYDGDLVSEMGRATWSPPVGDWFVVPEQLQPASAEGPATVGLRAIGSDGTERWLVEEDDGCTFLGVTAEPTGGLVVSQQCVRQAEQGGTTVATCQVTGHDPASGEPRWRWPGPDEAEVADCGVHPTRDLVIVVSNQDEERIAVGLDAVSGETRWRLVADSTDDLSGLENAVQAGDVLLGTQIVAGADLAHAELIVRTVADGRVQQRIGLPEGQPIQVTGAGGDHAAVVLYRPDTGDLLLADVDRASGISTEILVGDTPADSTPRRVNVISGPEALTMDILVAIGLEPGPDDFRLQVHGW